MRYSVFDKKILIKPSKPDLYFAKRTIFEFLGRENPNESSPIITWNREFLPELIPFIIKFEATFKNCFPFRINVIMPDNTFTTDINQILDIDKAFAVHPSNFHNGLKYNEVSYTADTPEKDFTIRFFRLSEYNRGISHFIIPKESSGEWTINFFMSDG